MYNNLDNYQVHENILWYLGKGHLLKNDIEPAKVYFNQIISANGDRKEESVIILNELKDINL